MVNQLRELPRVRRDMEVQERQPVDPVQFLLESFNGLREDVDNKLDSLAKEVRLISEYVTEAKAVEKARDLAAEVKELKQAVSAQKELNAEYRGQIIMLKWIAGATGFLVTVIGLLQLFKVIPGK